MIARLFAKVTTVLLIQHSLGFFFFFFSLKNPFSLSNIQSLQWGAGECFTECCAKQDGNPSPKCTFPADDLKTLLVPHLVYKQKNKSPLLLWVNPRQEPKYQGAFSLTSSPQMCPQMLGTAHPMCIYSFGSQRSLRCLRFNIHRCQREARKRRRKSLSCGWGDPARALVAALTQCVCVPTEPRDGMQNSESARCFGHGSRQLLSHLFHLQSRQ